MRESLIKNILYVTPYFFKCINLHSIKTQQNLSII